MHRYRFNICLAISLLLVLLSASHPAFAQDQVLRDTTNTNPPSVSATPTPGENRTANDAVVLAVEEYIRRFEGNTCFGQVAKLGDPAIYRAAAHNQLTIQDGAIGKLVTGKRAQGSHSDGTWATNGWIYLPWSVKTIGDDRNKQQTLWHEMNHHIEWITGRKKSGNDRNTSYMDRVSNEFNGWRKTEQDVKEGRRTPERARDIWNQLLQNLRDLEGGSAAGGQPPDSDLAQFTGFQARSDDVIALYRSGACGDALRDLANSDEALQERLEKGAKIVTANPSFALSRLGNPGELELRFTDYKLKKELEDGTLSLSWKSAPEGTFRQIGESFKTRFTASKPGTVKITAVVETRGPQKKNGTLQIDVPVTVPNDFLSLTLEPQKLKVGENGKATTDIEYDWNSRFIYTWRGENCEVENVDRLSTTFAATKPGTATVSVELQIDDADGNRISLITKSATFTVAESPGGGEKEAPAPDDDKGGQTAPPQVQPGAYTQPPVTQPPGQAGVQGGVSGQAGITAGVSGQAGIQGGTSGQAGIQGGTSGQAGITSGVSGPTGVQSGTSGQTGLASGVSGPTGGQTGTSSQTGITSGVSTGTGVGVTSTPPACTYEYSAWGECDRGIKKRTRSVIAKKPAGCVETGKLVLEERCDPPPTEEEKRQSYLNCLCACTPFWQSTPWYGSKECGGRGPCESRTFAYGTRLCSFINAKPECAASCYKTAYGKTGDPASIEKDIRDTNKKHKEAIKIKLNQEKCPVYAQLGDIITLTASVEGGIPPHRFSWSGNGQAKDNTFTFANSRQPGPHPISVTVTDNDGDTATAACTIIVEALTVKIELLDKEKKIPIGESRNFSGTVMAGDKPARGDFYFLWQPHPEILFSPFEKTGGNISGTKARFNKLGKFKVWVIAHTYKGNIKTTIGESEQIEIEVSKPEIKLSFQPQTPKVGQEVKLTATEKPRMDDKTIAFWWEISGNTLNPGPLKNEREYTFKPKDTKPVTVTVHGKAKDGGDDLGEDKATITAQEYTVSLSEPKYMGSKPKIWKCDTQLGRAANCGLVEVTKELAVFHDIFIKASVSPEPDKPPLRYAWAIDPAGICGIPGGGQELKINCSQTGTYTIKATVRDSQDIVLGTATTSASITISPDDLNKAKGPLVTLTADKTALKTGETAAITAAVQGGKAPYTYQWSTGVEGKGATASFLPKKSGEQKITVEVTDSAGKKNTANISIKVERAKLEVTLKSAKTDIKLGETVDVRAEAKGGEAPFTYAWGPDVAGKGDSLSYTAKKGGAQSVSVEVTDGAGQKARATVAIKVAVPKLEVALKADKTSPKIGETVSIQAIVKGGAPPVTHKWNAGVTAKGEVAQFTPKQSGTHRITVDVLDDAKQTSSAGIELKVAAPKLEVSLKADKTTLLLGEAASLQATIKGGEPPFVSQWGSGVEGKGETARFVADKPGMRKAAIEVSDRAGQKASASVDLKVEVPKLEVALAADKPTLKVGETGTIQAKVKGGMPEYAYHWSSFVSGKGGTASFTPQKTGLYKVWLEVKDKRGTKISASLDWKVETGQDGQTPQIGKAEKIAIEPENLKLAVGQTQTLRVMQVQPNGSKIPYTQRQVAWSGAPSQGIVVDGSGRVQATSLAKIGARVKIGAQDGPLKAEAWVEVVAPSTSTGSPVLKPAGPSTPAAPPVSTGAPATVAPPSMSLIIEPKTLSIATGKSADLKVFTFQEGRKIGDVTAQSTLMVSPGSGIHIDRNGRVTVEMSAKPGALEPVLATLKHPSGAILRADGSIRIEGAAKPPPTGYDPRTDPGMPITSKTDDLDKVTKIAGDFQKGQWTPLDDKIQKTKDQPLAQPQPPEYLSSSTTSVPSTVPPTTTGQPTTVAPTTGTPTTSKPTTTKPTTATTGLAPKDLADVTVDRRDVTITVWDHGTQDGDIINIYLNGKPLKNRLLLTSKKQSFRVQLTGGQNRFEVEAVNEGSTPPNTATVEISNVTKGKPSQVYERRTGQRASMNLTAP